VTYEAKQHYQLEHVASSYDAERFRGLRGRFVDSLEERMILRALHGLPSGARALDLPVGTGRMARRLESAGYRVTGADISLPMLRESQRAGRTPLVRGDAELLPLRDKSVDAAICLRLMSHLPPEARSAVLREMARVARERVVVVYQPHRFALWWLVYGGLLRRRLPRYYASQADLKREFSKAGLRVVRSHSLLRGVFMERAYVLATA
jgi:ubiquinone/menaquinone biosynthesis C-methylase UbiE